MSKVVRIFYRNHRGEEAERRIVPNLIYFGATQWHTEEQWLLDAYDMDKRASRTFALKDVLRWRADP
jgi:predicted DNA-binding transcriptional regulator YafY